jgi:hypothetical protein
VVLYLISKAFRPEFDVRGAQERAPDRYRAVPGLHSAKFGSRLQYKGNGYSVECCLQWTVSCTTVIVLKRNESRPECRPGSGLQRLFDLSYMISYGIEEMLYHI